MSRLNFVIFGASGFTGKVVVNELAALTKHESFSWGIAGRSKSKLNSILKTCEAETNIKLSNVETIIADLNDQDSMNKMCLKANILINCVGPYRFYGEDVIRQCLKTKTHHLDLSGEPEFLEKIQLKYNGEAREKNIFIIGSCGFDSAVADLGVMFTTQNSPSELSHIESILSVNAKEEYALNYATWESAVHGFSTAENLPLIRKKLFHNYKKPAHKLPTRINLLGYYYDQLLKQYCLSFLGSDKSVVTRSQQLAYEHQRISPVNFTPYITVNGFKNVLLAYLFGSLFAIMSKFKLGRYLLLRYYRFFSNGMISKPEDTKSNLNNIDFKFHMRGFAYNNESKQLKNVITTEITGPDPGYITASRIISHCALLMLKESNKIPSRGVLTPAFAFSKTDLIARLNRNGICFKIVEKKEEEEKQLESATMKLRSTL